MTNVTTIHGLMDESLLQKKEYQEDAPEHTGQVTEYWLNDELVHRSVHLFMKQGIDLFGQSAVLA